MNKNIKLIGAIILLAISALGCEKEKQTSHLATYEVVSVDGTPIDITVGYYTSESEEELGEGQEVMSVDYIETSNGEKIEIRTVVETSVTRWKHEFTFNNDEFLFYLIATINENENTLTQKHILVRIYVDGELMAENQNEDDDVDPTASVSYSFTSNN